MGLSYNRSELFNFPELIPDLTPNEKILAARRHRLEQLFLPAIAMILATLLLFFALWPDAVWHFIHSTIFHSGKHKKVLPPALPHPSTTATTHPTTTVAPQPSLSIPGSNTIHVVIDCVVMIIWILTIGVMSVEWVKWRYSVYVLTNQRFIRRAVDFQLAKRSIDSAKDYSEGVSRLGKRPFLLTKKEVSLSNVKSVERGGFGGIRLCNGFGKPMISINNVTRAGRFFRQIMQAWKAAQPRLDYREEPTQQLPPFDQDSQFHGEY